MNLVRDMLKSTLEDSVALQILFDSGGFKIRNQTKSCILVFSHNSGVYCRCFNQSWLALDGTYISGISDNSDMLPVYVEAVG